jgi:hypothetical protein
MVRMKPGFESLDEIVAMAMWLTAGIWPVFFVANLQAVQPWGSRTLFEFGSSVFLLILPPVAAIVVIGIALVRRRTLERVQEWAYVHE